MDHRSSLFRRLDDKGAFDFVAVVALVAVVLGFVDSPFLRSGLPLGDDTELHLYRLVDLDHLIRQGILYSRWQPDQVYGYGSPLFSFYAPLSAYLVEIAHVLGASFRAGMGLVFAAMPLVGGGSTYVFLRRRLASGPALLGATAYVSSLFFLYDIMVRGSISDGLAMALFPVVLMALDRLLDRPGPWRAALVSIAIAALLLSHNVSGPVLLPTLVACAGWWAGRRPIAVVWGATGIGLGVGLVLFFIGPAALGAVDTRVPEWLAQPAFHFDQHFVMPRDLFVLAASATPGSMLTNLPAGLGFVQVLAALAALPALPRFSPRVRGEVVIFAASAVGFAFLTIPASRTVWGAVSPLQVVSLPWRLLAVSDFAVALLIGYAADAWLPRREPAAGAAFGLAALVLLILAVPYVYPLPGDSLPANPSLADVTTFQQRSGAIGTTSNSEFLPRGLAQFPTGPPFPGADQGATLDQKLDPASIPAGGSVRAVEEGQLSTRLVISSPAPFVAHFFVFRFPGWSATVDERPATFGEPGPDRTLAVPVPAGQHELAVYFGESPSQLVFDRVSLFSVLGMVGLAITSIIRTFGATGLPAKPRLNHAGRVGRQFLGYLNDARRPGPGVSGILVATLVVIGLKWSVFDRVDTPLVRMYDGQRPPGMAVASIHRFGESLDLLGYTPPSGSSRPGQVVTFDLYWRTRATPSVYYSSFVHVLDANGQNLALDDNKDVADLPMTRWRIGAYARDEHSVKLPPNLPPGDYRVEVGIYDRSDHRMPIDGKSDGGETLELAPITVRTS